MKKINLLFILLVPLLVMAQQPFDLSRESANFRIYFDRSYQTEFIDRVLDQLEQDYRHFRDHFGLSVEGRTTIIVHPSSAVFLQNTGTHVGEFGTICEGIMHLIPLDELYEKSHLSAVLTQQVIRLILYSRLLNGCPRWLYEGAAAYFSGMSNFLEESVIYPVSLLNDLNELFLKPLSKLEFNSLIYLSSFTVESLIQHYSETNVLTFIRLFNGHNSYEEALRFSLGTSPENVEHRWRQAIQPLITIPD